MADAKKPDKGKAPPKPTGSSMESTIILYVIVALAIVFVVLPAILKLFGFSGNLFPSDFWERVTNAFMSFVTAISYVSIFLSLLLTCGIVYVQTMYGESKRKLEEMSSPKKPVHVDEPGPQNLNTGPDPRWRDIEGLMQSANTADWRIAILEADIMLDDMLTQMGYEGDSIGDKLKKVDRPDFKTLDLAWTAHKVRNNIAHEGASYQLTRDEADETINNFKKVFDEFYYV
jgi:hypothetical protein